MELCLFAAVQTQHPRHWVRAGIKMTQNQDCSSKIKALPLCVPWANVGVEPCCSLHWYHCLMDCYLSTICCKRGRNTSLYKFKFNCFSCQWPCLFYFWAMRFFNPFEKYLICISSFRSHSNPFDCCDCSRLQKVFHQLYSYFWMSSVELRRVLPCLPPFPQ